MTKTKRKRKWKAGSARLVGLPGVEAAEVYAQNVTSVTGAYNALRDFRAVTAAGDAGALNAYWNDEGVVCCEFYRRQITLESAVFPNRTAAYGWLAKWWPQLGR